MNQRSLIAILVVIIIALAGVVAYLAINQEETPTQTNVETGWETYTEENTGFSIDYPSDWPVQESGVTDCVGNRCGVSFGNSPQGPDDYDAFSNLIQVSISSPGAIAGSGIGPDPATCSNVQTTTLTSGFEADTKECINEMTGETDFYYEIENDGWVYQILSGKGEVAASVFDDMANSFTFVQ